MLVFDATPLIYLGKTEAIEYLDQLDEEKVIPKKVYEEVVEKGNERGELDAKKIEKEVDDGVFEIVSESVDSISDALSQADLQVLKIAENLDGTAVMDETAGRNAATARGVETRGTAFIILNLQKKKILTREQAENTLNQIIDAGWYCSTDLYKEILEKIKEIDKN